VVQHPPRLTINKSIVLTCCGLLCFLTESCTSQPEEKRPLKAENYICKAESALKLSPFGFPPLLFFSLRISLSLMIEIGNFHISLGDARVKCLTAYSAKRTLTKKILLMM